MTNRFAGNKAQMLVLLIAESSGQQIQVLCGYLKALKQKSKRHIGKTVGFNTSLKQELTQYQLCIGIVSTSREVTKPKF